MWESVECQALKNVKRLCVALIVLCLSGLYYHAYPSWLVVGIVAAILIVLAIRAACIQYQYNHKPWEHGGKECDFSEK